jgi:V/A-type H+-transporting ATPase subunit E
MTEKERSSGVQELIDRLREKGVEEGQEQADQLLTDARRKASETVDKARREAAEIVQQAKQEADRLQAAGEEALRLAGRDAVLALKEEISEQFSKQVRRLVSHQLRDEKFIERLILEIAGRAVPKDSKQPIELLLPEEMALPEQKRLQAKGAQEGAVGQFVLGLAGDMLREGVTLAASADNTPGVTVKMVEEDVEITFDEKAVTEFLLRYLLPRFRNIMTGIVQ